MTKMGVKSHLSTLRCLPKPGRKSHHPMIAFINDLKLAANLWLRSGDT